MDKELLEKGYIEFTPSKEFKPNVDRAFQKKFADEYGKQYFITVYMYKPWLHPYTHEEFTSKPEFNVQLYSSNGHNPLNLEFFAGWTIDEVETYVRKIFLMCDINRVPARMFDYYERF